MKFVQKDYINKTEILKFPDHYVAIAVTVDDTGLVADAEGKKIVKAGTIVGGGVLADDTLKVSKKNTQGTDATQAEGVLLNDVDATYGPASGAMVIHGFIAKAKLPEVPAAEAVTALQGRIMFIK